VCMCGFCNVGVCVCVCVCLGVFCNVWVYCTFIYCVSVLFIYEHLFVFILICFVCTSVRTTATE